MRTRGESCGGVVTCVVRGCPKGLGNPVFDKLEAELAKAMLSLPATKVSSVAVGVGSATQQQPHQQQTTMAAAIVGQHV